MKKYVILAGVNGAGKSTLFSVLNSLSEIEKINLDEIARNIGDWQDSKVILQAGRIVINRINDYFSNGISFSQETTLCGKSIIANIQKAKSLGYNIEMHYIGLDNPEIAKQRVHYRVNNGGHGISDRDIERRYNETLKNLISVIPLRNLAAIYDNSEALRRFAIFKDGQCVHISSNVPNWYNRITKL